jgi:UDP-N-acetylmuramate dehydrogenase
LELRIRFPHGAQLLMKIQEHMPLAPYTTFGIGGPARWLAEVTTTSELREAVMFGGEHSAPLLILGGGSNVLLPDEGWDGLVIKIASAGISLDESGEASIVVAGAGESWDAVVSYANDRGVWGIENLSGIPGTVGGAVAGNIGAYGQALSQTLLWAETFDLGTLTTQTFSAEACSFDYRDSFFKHTSRYIILRAAFALSKEPRPELSYKDLAVRLGSSASLGDIRDAVLAIRKAKFPNLAVEGTAGSFFKNPIISKADAHRLTERYPSIPLFEMPETDGLKVPLAWLLDHELHLKGHAVGGARLFEQQPLVIAAQKGTSAHDVVRLAEFVEQHVQQKCNLTIEREVKIV